MKKLFFSIIVVVVSLQLQAQQGYEIRMHLPNVKDTVAYLTYFQFGNKITRDTCHKIKNGEIVFKGKGRLENGIYALTGQNKRNYFDFFIDETTQHLELKSNEAENQLKDVAALNSQSENDFFNYIRYLIAQNREIQEAVAKGKGLSKKDSIAVVMPQLRAKLKGIYEHEEQFIAQNKGSYMADVINLKIDRSLYDAPNASNGRPDSLLIKKYFRQHFWDGVDFNRDGIYRNQFFAAKINNYLDNVIAFDTDSVSVAIDKLFLKTKSNPALSKLLMDHLVSKYEQASMGFDKILLYLADTYFKTGKAKSFYPDPSDFSRVLKRADKIRPLQIGQVAPDLFMIKASDRDKIAKMGFESLKNNNELTQKFTANEKTIRDMFLRMNSVQAEYLIVVFWDADCSHCKIEIPKLLNVYHQLQKQGKDVKVYSVYVQHEPDKYLKYIADKNLDWINVYDGVYYNNVIDKYEVITTPTLYILDKNKVIIGKKVPVEKIPLFLETLARPKS